MNKLQCLAFLLILNLTGCASQQDRQISAQAKTSSRAMMIDLMGEAPPEPDMQLVQQQPLGSVGNPVRVNGPNGETRYFEKLECPAGDRVKYERLGSAGTGPYGFILDKYKVSCANGPEKEIYMDMYHVENIESRAVEPFVVVEE